MFDQMKLGRLPAEPHRTLPLLRDVAKLPAAWTSADWSRSVAKFRMSLNDQLGTCAIAAMANYHWQCGIYVPLAYGMTDDEVRACYQQLGWNPADPATDIGVVEVRVLDAWKQGVSIGGKIAKIDGYAAIPSGDVEHVKVAIDALGGVFAGVSMPISAQRSGVWDVVTGPDGARDSWGGHEMLANGYDADTVQFVTWGVKQRATWAWWLEYVEEVQAVLSLDWMRVNTMVNPAGVDWATVRAVL